MEANDVQSEVARVLSVYDPQAPAATADGLRDLWMQFAPNQTPLSFTADQRAEQEIAGVPIPDLRVIAKALVRPAKAALEGFIPLMHVLWADYGREGKVVALIPLGHMAQVAPERFLPLLKDLCRSCVTWEDADRLAMDALEPVVRKDPDRWMPTVELWLSDVCKWVRRAGVTVVGRLTMKHAEWTVRCLEMTERLVTDQDTDVKRAVSFAIRVSARGDRAAVRDFLYRSVPPENDAATWVLCDAIRSMTKRFLPAFSELLPRYELWGENPELSSSARRSVESAIKTLRRAQT